VRRRNRSKTPREPHSDAASLERIYGVHAARAALGNPRRRIQAVHATSNGLGRISDLIETLGVNPVEVSPSELSKRLGNEAVHQGVLVDAEPLPAPEIDEVMHEASAGRPLIVLDQVTDPHNAGAILRSAAAFNASAVVMTRRNSPPLDGVLTKAASGAVEHVPVLLVANLARTLNELGRRGVLRIGLEGEAQQALETADVSHPCALVLGAEHKGLRRLTAEHCDLLCHLQTTGPIRSLNVSNAAAVALHTITVWPR
jgi:23S rRNA (guanosine2251-2'-O)-methyltransferase